MRVLCLLLLGPLLIAPRPARAETARVIVLHTTDLHGALTDRDDGLDQPAARGLTRVATLVRRVRAGMAPVVLVDGGDAIQGPGIESAWRTGHRPGMPDPDRHDAHAPQEPMMAAMSRLGYDAMAVGNHEFSFGPAAMEKAQLDAEFPWLADNVVRAADGSPAFRASLVKMAGPVRVGIVGVTTPAVPAMEDSAHWAGLRFLPPIEATRREVERLRGREQCDVVVVVAHTGLERDRPDGPERPGDTPDENWGWRLATEVPGIDVLILGHTHAVVPFLKVGGTLVTQAGKWGEGLGRVDLDLTRAAAGQPWTITRKFAAVMPVDSVAADSELTAFAAPWHVLAESVLTEPVGRATRPLASPRGRFADGAVWELIQRAQLAASGADVSLAALPDPLATVAPGPMTQRDLLRLYPYDNTLVVVRLTGAELKDVLEQSARYLQDYTWEDGRPLAVPGWPAWNFDAAEGVSYEIDLTRPVGQRIVNLLWNGHPLAAEQVLQVAVNSYRANGGGGFAPLVHAPRVRTIARGVRELIADEVRKAGTIDGSFTANWSLLPDYAGAPERPLIDRLVRHDVAPKDEVLRLGPDEPARRGDLAYWLARAFGWREKKLSGAFADAPDSLEPWLDGLLKRKVLGEQATAEYIEPFAPASLTTALDWCVAAARHEQFDLTDAAAYRRGLLAGVSAPRDTLRTARGPRLPLTRAQLLGVVANTRFPVVRVLETTDFHGFVFPSRDRRSGRSLGGSAVLAAWLARLAAENPEGTLLLDGGDCFQGTMISNLQFGRPVVEQMNALRYAATAIGNHEFDWTVDTLAQRVREMRFAALGANMVERTTSRMPGWVRADTLVSRRGVRIGVLGLCYRNTPTVTLPANVAQLRFDDDSATAAVRVPLLRQRGAQVVVEVGHIPAESDSLQHAVSGDLPRLARGVRGVDLWLGGHSHNRVVDEIAGTPVMIAGAHGEVVGVADLVVDPVAGRVIEHHTRLQPTWTDEVTPDSAMAARITRWNAGIDAQAARPVTRSVRALTRATPGGGDSGIGDLVSDAMREAAGADIALQNSGGLRADLPEGVVTRGALYEVMPFDNTIVVEQLTGTEVRSLFADRALPQSGLRVSIDPARPEGQRLAGLTLADGRPIDPAATYTVAMNNFMAQGGDNLALLSRTPHRDTSILVRDALERYIVQHAKAGVLDYATDGRIARVGGGAASGTHD
jgi:2',3'-cyclic-nucleotide 2'-phosphodiesterase / 3'-nucleotidase / 5'-nucleotidase